MRQAGEGRQEMTFAAAIPLLLAAAQIDLAGEWRLSGRDGAGTAIECPIAVPGDVHSALLAAKIIPDPYFGANEPNVLWVSRRDWTVSCEFDVPADFLASRSIVLRLDDVDTFATVRVNGGIVGRTCNRFRRWEFDVKRLLRPGRNVISGEFRCAWDVAEGEAAKSPREYPRYPNGMLASINHIRKPQCHGGWDWGMTQMTTGFCGETRLVATDDFRIDHIYSSQDFNGDFSRCDLTVFAEITEVDGSKAVVTNIFSIENPCLWWPNGMGRQDFHEVVLDVRGRKIPKRIGLRKIEMVSERDVDPATGMEGRSCFFRVNGRDMFARGANWIPCDAFENRQTPERYRDLLESARAANMNMIRIWGGGRYEKDAFYDICDELGLMVWHDFMFACANYPPGDFLDNVREEVVHQLKRLRDHASIALWCGDNECRATWRGSWPAVKDDPGHYHHAYLERIGLLRSLVARYDPARAFWPGSPCNGPDDDMTGDCEPSCGDFHYWGVWHGGLPFRSFGEVTPRFCSEFGFQSYPSRETCLSFCRPEEMSLDSSVFEHHQKDEGGNRRIHDTMRMYFREPAGFDGMLYLSQVQQALAIKTAVELWRSRKPACMGILYWQLDDSWPVASWSSIEYGGKWKHLHYHARRFFADVAVLPTENPWNARKYALAVANDGMADVTAELVVEPWLFDGKAPRDDAPKNQYLRRVITVPAGGVKRFGHRWGDKGFYAMRFADAENAWFSTSFRDCDLAPAKVAVARVRETLVAGRRKFEMDVCTDLPAFFVWLSAQGIRGEFSDNSFMLLPGRPRTVSFTPKTPGVSLEAFRSALRLTHLAENCTGRPSAVPPGGTASPGLATLGLDG